MLTIENIDKIKSLKSWNRLKSRKGLVKYLTKAERKAEVAWDIMMSLT